MQLKIKHTNYLGTYFHIDNCKNDVQFLCQVLTQKPTMHTELFPVIHQVAKFFHPYHFVYTFFFGQVKIRTKILIAIFFSNQSLTKMVLLFYLPQFGLQPFLLNPFGKNLTTQFVHSAEWCTIFRLPKLCVKLRTCVTEIVCIANADLFLQLQNCQ